jgi:transposase
MARNFRREDREQGMLFPPSIDDWLAEDHFARFIRETIVTLDEDGRLGAFYESYREDGRGGSAYHPVTLLCVLIYAYCEGIMSSRKIARGIVDNVPLRYLAANQLLDHRTINSFRKRHHTAFHVLFSEILKLCQIAGLVDLGRIAIDGRKVKASACRDKTVTGETLDREIAAIAQELVEEAEKVDEREDDEFGDDDGHGMPPGFRTKEERLERLKQAKRVLEEREQAILAKYEEKLEARRRFEEETGEKKRGPEPKKPDPSKTKNRKTPPKANTTDPDSRLMKVRQGFVQGYNAQAAVDCKTQVIVGQLVTQDVVDNFQLKPVLARVQAETGLRPQQAVADAGYWSPENSDLQEEIGVELFIATKKDSKQRKAQKVTEAPRGRIPKSASARERMERKLLTKRGKAAYRTRGHSVEGVFGQMENRGLGRFLVRGVEAVKAEWALWSGTHNLLKLFRATARA